MRIDFTSRMPGLRKAADYLSEGRLVLAQIAAVQLCCPICPVMKRRFAYGRRQTGCAGSILITIPRIRGEAVSSRQRRNVAMFKRNTRQVKVAYHLRKMVPTANSPMRSMQRGLHCAVSLMSPGVVPQRGA
jgi:hypothetical protein